MIKAVRDIFLLKVDSSTNRTIKIAGQDMFFDPEYDKYKNAIQKAEVVSVPASINKKFKNDFEVKIGDTVYVHHFIIQDENIVETDDGRCYACNYGSIFCVVRNGEIFPLEDWVFAKPILEDESSFKTASGIYLKSAQEAIKLEATVEAASPYCQELGLKKGDRIHFIKDADYELVIDGVNYYRIAEDCINGILIDSE